jgi:hypothetical protein
MSSPSPSDEVEQAAPTAHCLPAVAVDRALTWPFRAEDLATALTDTPADAVRSSTGLPLASWVVERLVAASSRRGVQHPPALSAERVVAAWQGFRPILAQHHVPWDAQDEHGQNLFHRLLLVGTVQASPVPVALLQILLQDLHPGVDAALAQADANGFTPAGLLAQMDSGAYQNVSALRDAMNARPAFLAAHRIRIEGTKTPPRARPSMRS